MKLHIERNLTRSYMSMLFFVLYINQYIWSKNLKFDPTKMTGTILDNGAQRELKNVDVI